MVSHWRSVHRLSRSGVIPATCCCLVSGFPELAKLLALDAATLARRLAQRSDREFVYIKRRISPELAAEVPPLEIPGVHSQREYQRFYPGGEVISHVLGFTNVDDQGQEGSGAGL